MSTLTGILLIQENPGFSLVPTSQIFIIFPFNPFFSKKLYRFSHRITLLAPGQGFLRPTDIRRFDIIGVVNSDDQNIDEITKLESEEKRLEINLDIINL